MPNIPITIACGSTDRTAAIRDGRVKVEGCDATYLPLYPEESFHRVFKFQEFDIAQRYSGSSLIRMSARRSSEFIGIRRSCRACSGIRRSIFAPIAASNSPPT